MTQEEKEIRRLKKEFIVLCEWVACFIVALDRAMKLESNNSRGRIIAKWTNELDMALDKALHFGLQLSFPRMKHLKRKWIKSREIRPDAATEGLNR